MKRISDIIKGKSEIWSVAPDQSVFEAIKLMAEKGIGALLVMDGESLCGILSERDYARKVILANKSSRETPVGDIMTKQVLTTTPTDTVDHCMGVMTEKRIRHLPVVDDDKVLGMISLGDCVKTIIDHQRDTIDQLESYINS